MDVSFECLIIFAMTRFQLYTGSVTQALFNV